MADVDRFGGENGKRKCERLIGLSRTYDSLPLSGKTKFEYKRPISPFRLPSSTGNTLDDAQLIGKKWCPYVTRRQLREVLEYKGLSINAAAKMLGRGKQFRKWASSKGAPDALTTVTSRDIVILMGEDCLWFSKQGKHIEFEKVPKGFYK